MGADPPEESRSAATVAGSCPAFTDGCPYASNDNMVEWIKDKRDDATKVCPAFKDGCPFMEVGDMDALRKQLEALPPSHAGNVADDGKPQKNLSGSTSEAPHTALMGMLKAVHKASQSLKQTVGGDCPVFQEACPFKNCVTSSGTPLALELETRSWGLWIQESSPQEQQEAPKDGEGLAQKLKEGTQEAHKTAETVHFVREFIKGRVNQQVYAQFIVNLFHVYSALEEALEENSEHPLVESLHFPEELERTATLKQDAEYFLGPDWEKATMPSKVTNEYVSRLQHIAKESPELLVPHAYTRYLGDLSGGQVLRRAAVRGMQLPDDGSGVRFYIFKRIRDAKVFKNMYRARMDNLPADSATADRMVVEANYAFSLNTRIFQELDSLAGFEAEPVPPPPTDPAPAAVAKARAGDQAAAAGCPFAALAAEGMEMPADHPKSEKAHVPVQKATKTNTSKASSVSSTKMKADSLALTVLVLLLALFLGSHVLPSVFG